jgi:hypothetical protein
VFYFFERKKEMIMTALEVKKVLREGGTLAIDVGGEDVKLSYSVDGRYRLVRTYIADKYFVHFDDALLAMLFLDKAIVSDGPIWEESEYCE